MKKKLKAVLAGAVLALSATAYAGGSSVISSVNMGSAEIGAYDSTTGRLFVANSDGLRALTLNPDGTLTLDGTVLSHPGATSVTCKNGYVAVSYTDNLKQNKGHVAVYKSDDFSAPAKIFETGYLPDMVTFTHDGKKILVANEGEPNDTYTVDPAGSVSVINLQNGLGSATVSHVGFTGWDSQKTQLQNAGVRIFGKNATVSQDLEPEYITVSSDNKFAYVGLQENNAVAKLDLQTNQIVSINSCGLKVYSKDTNQSNFSDKDGTATPPADAYGITVYGMRQPDSIGSITRNGKTYIITTNEGDGRDYDGFSEEARAGEVEWSTDVFTPEQIETLKDKTKLGRLKISTAASDTDNDGIMDRVVSFGGRGFTIYNENMQEIFDCGDTLEQALSAAGLHVEKRDDDKGPEPEGLAIGELMDGRTVLFVGLERAHAVAVFDISGDPDSEDYSPALLTILNNNGDEEPEGLEFISGADNPTGQDLLMVCNEETGTVTLYNVTDVPEPGTLVLLSAGALALIRRRRKK